jgi:Uma2 family endonuclease
MTTATAPIVSPPERVLLRNVSWETYESLLRDLDGQQLRLTYDGGRLEILSPSPRHGSIGKLVARIVETLTLERNIPLVGLSNTTWKNRRLAKGLEADECYYVQRASWAAGRDEFDLTVDPPPDLAIEVDISRSSVDKQSIYAAMGVPELWRYDADSLSMLLLEHDRYRPISQSVCLPMLTPQIIERFASKRGIGVTDTDILVAFRDWLRQQPG